MLAVPAVLGLTWALGLSFGVVTVITCLIPVAAETATASQKIRRSAARALLFAAAWMLQEWTRSWILTGFPWNPVAIVWSESVTPLGLDLQQSVSVIGTFGLSLITVAAAGLCAVLGAAPRARAAWIWAGAPLAGIALIAGVGALRLTAPTTVSSAVKVRLVQPNVPQAEKWRPGLREIHLQDYVDLSTANRPDDVNVVVWGEASISFFLDRDTEHRRIAAAAAPAGGLLIAGGDRAESETRIFNSLYVITPNSDIAAVYDKHHLVPFGEYMPLAAFLPSAIRQLTGDIGFSAGPGSRTIAVPGLPAFAPLICYEAIFPGQVVAPGDPAPRWMLNLTNDSWFGTLTGPYQHFATARLRAIEQGLPLVRAANTGISGVVDPYGRVLATLGLDRRGVVDAVLPDPTPGPTLFAIFGNLVSLLGATVIVVAALLLYRREN
jgi:apolipoprotein N-acyltransferase